ncbi:MAG: WbqC family protein [Butyricicoccus sp.]
MKLGIMQPYFFPYLGYWQLMNAVDTYVIYDDVAYIKKGWVNRNRIKINGSAVMITVPVKDASQNRLICEHELALEEKTKAKLLRTVGLAYCRAPYYETVMALLHQVFDRNEKHLSTFLFDTIRTTADYLGITTQFLLSSELEKENRKKGTEKILDICCRLGATEYYNAIGGTELYDRQEFQNRGMQLHFLKMDEDICYPQGKGDFIPYLSILDVMMYNSPEQIQEYMTRYTLV